MSTLAILLIAFGVIVLLLLVGGLVAVRRRDRRLDPVFERDLAAADNALEAARAEDRGWDRGAMEDTARRALAASHPGREFTDLHLVLVDDRPGVHEDRAHFQATDGQGDVRVVLSRGDEGWAAEQVE